MIIPDEDIPHGSDNKVRAYTGLTISDKELAMKPKQAAERRLSASSRHSSQIALTATVPPSRQSRRAAYGTVGCDHHRPHPRTAGSATIRHIPHQKSDIWKPFFIAMLRV